MKICVACSAGGHLTEISQIKESYEKYDHFYITFRRENSIDLTKKERVYFVEDPGRSIRNLIKCIFQSFKILWNERPKAIMSTGAGVAVPACFIGKIIFKSKIIFIESFCRIYRPSLTGRAIYSISNLFFVQWEELLKKYGDKAVFKGRVF